MGEWKRTARRYAASPPVLVLIVAGILFVRFFLPEIQKGLAFSKLRQPGVEISRADRTFVPFHTQVTSVYIAFADANRLVLDRPVDETLQDLYPFRHELESLHVINPVSERGLQSIAAFRNLSFLGLSKAPLATSDMSWMVSLPKLRGLSLSDGTDSTIEALASIPAIQGGLKFLYISNSKVTDKGVAYLPRLKALDDLDADMLEISDASIPYLGEIPSLRYLLIFDTRITPAGRDRLSKISPSLKIGYRERREQKRQ